MIKEVFDVMVGFTRAGMTMVVVTHETGFARQAADRVVFMEAGQIIESGMPDKFFGNTRAEGARDALSKILAP